MGTDGVIRGKTILATYRKFRVRINRKAMKERTGLYMANI